MEQSSSGGAEAEATESLDVLVVGAGIAGIGFAYHLARAHPRKSFAVLESRDRLGGTWDLFRYPGVRSDVDMHLYGFAFQPWEGRSGVVSGDQILDYLEETVDRHGLRDRIRYGTRVRSASWSSERARWSVTIESRGTPEGPARRSQLECRWLQLCTGYYSHAEGHRPQLPGEERFAGTFVHPQFWPRALDVAARQVVVIGSGATAVTLVPALVERGAHVTMLQRTPTYVYASPQDDPFAARMRGFLPAKWSYWIIRWRKLMLDRLNYRVQRWWPSRVKRILAEEAAKYSAPGFDYERHFVPDYQIGRQRVCVAPRGDLFAAIRDGGARVVTGRIADFAPAAIRLHSGEEIGADIVVTATGLKLTLAGGIPLDIDGERVAFPERWVYRGVMFSGVPNLAITVGSFVSPYTLRVEMISRWVAKVLAFMDERGARTATPTLPVPAAEMPRRPFTEEFDSGYVRRAAPIFPKQGAEAPWTNPQSYGASRRAFTGRVDDGSLRLT